MSVFRVLVFLYLVVSSAMLGGQALTGVSPPRADTNAPRDSNVVATFNAAMQTPGAGAFSVRGSLTGTRGGGLSGGGTSTLTFDPTANFLPNELVSVTLTSGVLSTGSSPLTNPTTWQFTGAAAPGPAVFGDFRTTLSTAGSLEVCVGDFNGDGRLDVAIPRSPGIRIFWNSASIGLSGSSYTDVAAGGAALNGDLVSGDVDGDGDLDFVFSASNGAPGLARNNGGAFTITTLPGPSFPVTYLATGDVDNDGDLDVVGAPFGGAAAVYVYKNDGFGVFSAPQSYGTGNQSSIAIGDLDNDGDLDVATSRAWHFNDGTGGFAASVSYPFVNAAYEVQLGDLDGDGDLDQMFSQTGPEIFVYLNGGSGNFNAGQLIVGGGSTLTLGDIDGDGDLDLLRIANGVNGTQFLFNDGSATFGNPFIMPGGSDGYASALADLDGDGDLDAVIVHSGNVPSEVVYNRFNQSDVTLAAGPLTEPSSLDSITATSAYPDVLDFRVADSGSASLQGFAISQVKVGVSGTANASYHAWRLNVPGVGTFPGVVSGALGAQTITIAVSGLVVPSGGFADLQLQVQTVTNPPVNQDNLTFAFSVTDANINLVGGSQFAPSQPAVTSPSPVQYQVVATQLQVVTQPPAAVGTGVPFVVAARYADANGNVDLDVQGDVLTATRSDSGTIPAGTSGVAVNGIATFIGSTAVVLGAPPANGIHLILTDNSGGSINLSGSPVNTQTFNVSVLTALTSTQPLNNATYVTPNSTVQGVFSGPMAAPAASQLRVHSATRGMLPGGLSGGTTNTLTFTPGGPFKAGESIEVSFTSGLLDMASTPIANPGVVRFTAQAGTGPAVFTSIQQHHQTGQSAMALADVNGDGLVDLLCGSSSTPLNVSLNLGGGAFGAAQPYGAGFQTNWLVPADFDGDGDVDVLWVGGDMRVFLNDGSGVFTAQPIFGSLWASVRPVCGDFDADGDIDIIVRDGGAVLYRNDGSATFGNTLALGSGTPVALASGDFDGDRRLDVVVATSTGAQLFLNTGASFSAPLTVGAATNVKAVAAADVDGDGDLDVVIGSGTAADSLWINNGSGGFSSGGNLTATAQSTRALTFADLDGDGDLDLARATEGNKFNTWQPNQPGSFSAAQNLELSAVVAIDVASADIDGDGDLDLALMLSDGRVRACMNEYTRATVGVNPAEHEPSAPVSTNVSATFASAMGAPSAQNFIVSGAFTGRRAGGYSGGGTATLVFDPAVNFKPGELVSVTINQSLLDGASNPIDSPAVWRFHGAAGAGPGVFSAVQKWALTNLHVTHAATADFDGDGDIDLACCTSTGVHLFSNNGAGQMSAPQSIYSGNVSWAAAGDIDGDGDVDLALRSSSDTLLVLRNSSPGFQLAESISGANNRLILADLNGDGFPEVICGNSFWRNNGSGSFDWAGSKVTLGSSTGAFTGAAGDIDLDGDLDLLIWTGGTANLYANDGLGAFTPVQSVATTGGRTEAADIDGDGDVDFVVRNTSGLYILRNNGGAFSALATISGTTSTNSLTVADLDGDGDLDVAMSAAAGSFRNLALFNNGSGVFGTPVPFGLNRGLTADILCADMDGDGDIDLITTENGLAIIHMNEAVGAPALVQQSPASGTALVPADQVLRLDFNRVMSATGTSATLPGFSNLHSAVVVTAIRDESSFDVSRQSDFKANELIEVVVSSALVDEDGTPVTNPRVIRLRAASVGPGDASFASPVSVGGAAEATRAIAAGDLNLDNNIDLVLGNYGGANRIYYGNGTGGFTAGPVVGTGADNTQCLLLMDLNRDNRLDIVVGNNGQSAVYLNATSNPWTASVPFGTSTSNTTALACGDINLDGWRDLVAVESGGQNRCFLNNGGGGLTSGTNLGAAGSFSRAVALADLDNDGDLDVVIGNDGAVNQYYLNSGGSFGAAQTLASSHLATRALAVADLNGDTWPDIVVANNGQNEVFLNNGSGGFGSGAAFGLAASVSTAVDLGDFNGDGNLDIAVANDGSQAAVDLNNGSGGFASSKLFGPLQPAGAGIVAVDFNGDRLLELALGVNLGQSQVFRNDYVPVIDNDATVTASAALTEPTTINSVTGTVSAIPVLDFTLTDGGTADALPTKVLSIKVNFAGTNSVSGATWTLNGPGVSNAIALLSGGFIRFDDLNIVIPDGTSQTFTVSMQLKTNGTLADGGTWQMSVSAADITTAAYSTGFTGSGTVDNGTGLMLTVVATKLTVQTQPPSQVTQEFSFDVVVAYTDAYGRIDRDVMDQATLSRTDSGAVLSPAALAAVDGVVSFIGSNAVVLGAPAATGITLQLTDDATGVSAGSVLTDLFSVVPPSVWTGTVSSDWTNAGNWSTNVVPGALDSVRIPQGTPNTAALAGSTTVRDLYVAMVADVNLGSFSLTVSRRCETDAALGAYSGRIILSTSATVYCGGSASLHNVTITGAPEMGSNIRVTGNLLGGSGTTLSGPGLEVRMLGSAAQLITTRLDAHLRISNTSAAVAYEPWTAYPFTSGRRLLIDSGAVGSLKNGTFEPGAPAALANAGELRIDSTSSTSLDAGGLNLGNVTVAAGLHCYFDNLGPANTGTFTIETGASLAPRGVTDLSNATINNFGLISYTTSGGTQIHSFTPPAANIGKVRFHHNGTASVTIATALICNDLTFIGTSVVTFQGLVTVNGNLEHQAPGTTIPRLELVGSGARTILGGGGTITELFIGGTVDATLTGTLKLASDQSGTARALTVASGATLNMQPAAELQLGTAAAGAECRIDGTLRTSTLASQIRPRLKTAGPGFVLLVSGNLDCEGLFLEGLGRSAASYGLDVLAGATVTRFDWVEIASGASTVAAVALNNASAPTAFASFRIDGAAPQNIDATGFLGSAITISSATTGGGALFGAAFEIDPSGKLNWTSAFTVVSTSPPANQNNAAVTASVDATFSAPAATPPTGSFLIQGGRTGRVAGNISGSGTQTLSLAPVRPFYPGEEVEVLLRNTLTDMANNPLAGSRVYRFRAAATGGNAVFSNPAPIGNNPISPPPNAHIVDMNRDGRPDLLLTQDNSSTQTGDAIRICVSDGMGGFPSVQTISSNNQSCAALADFNQDGWMDVVVGASLHVFVYLNLGTGLLDPTPLDFPIPTYFRVLQIGDLNGDGYPDIAGCADGTASNPAYVLLNDAANGVQPIITLPAHNADSLALGDVDGDGDLDIVRGRLLLLNDGTAGFSSSYWSATNYRFAALGDLDSDGDLDILAMRLSSQDAVFLNNGAGQFTFGSNLGVTATNYQYVSLGDLDGDGDLDAIVNGNGIRLAYINAGNATFGTATLPSASQTSWQTATPLGDLDGDGDLDAVFRIHDSLSTPSTKFLVYYNDTHATTPPLLVGRVPAPNTTAPRDSVVQAQFSAPIGTPPAGALRVIGSHTGSRPGLQSVLSPTVVAFDASNDFAAGERVTVKVAPGVGSPPTLFAYEWTFVARSNTAVSPTFEAATSLLPGAAALNTTCAAVGDFDGDGDIDVVIGVSGAANQVYLNDGFGQFIPGPALGGATDTRALLAIDIDEDGDVDLLEANYGQANNIYRNSGGVLSFFGTFGTSNDNTTSLDAADIDGDGDADILVGNYAQQSRIYLNDGNLGFAGFIDVGAGTGTTTCVAIIDLVADGRPDIVLVNETGNSEFLKQQIGVVFTLDWQPLLSGVKSCAKGDKEGDGFVDLLCAGQGWVQGGSNQANWGGSVNSANCVALTEATGDGDVDYVQGRNGISEVKGSYSNSSIATFGAAGDVVIFVACADFDGDGRADALCVHPQGQSSRVRFNREPVPVLNNVNPDDQSLFADTLTIQATFDVGMQPASTSTFPVFSNLRGRIDGNYGQSGSPYKSLYFYPSSSVPGEVLTVVASSQLQGVANGFLGKPGVWTLRSAARLGSGAFAAAPSGLGGSATVCIEGDFDNDGDIDFCVAGGSTAETRVYWNSGGSYTSAVISTGRDTRALAAADLDSDGDLDLVEGNYNQASNVYLNGSGSFGGAGVIGSAAPTRGIAVSDFDGDGKLDVVAANYGAQSLILYGNGTGGFTASAPIGGTTDNTTCVAVLTRQISGAKLPWILLGKNGQNVAYSFDGSAYSGVNFGSGSDDTVALAVGDFNEDGKTDVLIGNGGGQSATICLATVQGFGTPSSIGAAATTHSIAVADFNADDNLDVVLVRGTGADNELLAGNGSGGFASPVALMTSLDSRGACPGDFDFDGDIDIYFTDGTQGRVWLNGGTAPSVISTTPARESLAANPSVPWGGTFNLPLSSAATAHVRLWGELEGYIPVSASVAGNTLSFTAPSVRAGSRYSITFLRSVPSASNAIMQLPHAFQFRPATQAAPVSFASFVDVGGASTWYGSIVADFDGDGHLDIVASQGTSLVMFTQTSPLVFVAGTPFGPSETIIDLTPCDLNGDSKMDFVARASVTGNLAFIAQIGGAFTWTTISPSGSVGGTADLEGDGDQDILLNLGAAGTEMLINDGSGSFTSGGLITGAAITGGRAIQVDFNGDGLMDLAVGTRLLKNTGSGFVTYVTFGAVVLGMADFDGDGDLDVVTDSWFYPNNNGVFQQGGASGLGEQLLAHGDVDGDGDLDLLMRELNGAYTIYRYDGSFTFTPIPVPHLNGFDTQAQLADLNGDGRLDIVAHDYGNAVRVLLQGDTAHVVGVTPDSESQAGLSAPATVTFDAAMNPATLAANGYVAHSNMRGRLAGSTSFQSGNTELSFTPSAQYKAGELVQVSLQTGLNSASGDPLDAPYVWRFRAAGAPAAMVFPNPAQMFANTHDSRDALAVDFDGDGDIDLLISTELDQDYIYWNDGPGVFTTRTAFGAAGTSFGRMAGADLDMDGDIDVVIVRDAQPMQICLNQGGGSFTFSTHAQGGKQPVLADMNGDGLPDIVTTSGYSFGTGGGTFGSVNSWPSIGTSATWVAAAVADFNGDGRLDSALAAQSPIQIRVMLNVGGLFNPGPSISDFGYSVTGMEAADLDNDGDPDLVVGTNNSYPRVVRNTGGGSLASWFTGPSILTSDGQIEVADFNGDGKLDFLIGADSRRIFIGNASDSFTSAKSFSSLNGAAVADFDGDSRMDVIGLKTAWDMVWLNQSPSGALDASLSLVSSTPSLDSVTAAQAPGTVMTLRVTDNASLDTEGVTITQLAFVVIGLVAPGEHAWSLLPGAGPAVNGSYSSSPTPRIVFSGLNLQVPSGGTLDCALQVQFASNPAVTRDNDAILAVLDANNVVFGVGSRFPGSVSNNGGTVYEVVATDITWATVPGNGMPGAPLSVQPVISVTDAAGNPDLDAAGQVVMDASTVAPGPVSPVLGNRTQTLANATAAFTNIQIDQPGTAYRLRVAFGSISGDSPGFDVVSGAVAQPPLFISLRVMDADAGYKAGDTISLRAVLNNAGYAVSVDLSGVDSVLGSVPFIDHANGTYTLTSPALSAATLIQAAEIPVVVTATNSASLTSSRTVLLSVDESAPAATVWLNQPVAAVGPGTLKITLTSNEALHSVPKITITGLTSQLNVAGASMSGAPGSQAFAYTLSIPSGATGTGTISIDNALDIAGNSAAIGGVSQFTLASAAAVAAVAQGPQQLDAPRRIELDAGASTGATSYAWTQVGGPTVSLATPAQALTTVDLIVAGSYSFMVTVSDGTNSANDVLTVVLANSDPIVRAGRDQHFTTMDVLAAGSSQLTPLALQPSVFDPNGDTLTFEWVVMSSPPNGNLRILNPTQLDSRVEVLGTTIEPGVYSLGMRVWDKHNLMADETVSDSMRIVVSSASVNSPAAHAGFGVVGLVGQPVQLSGHESADSDAVDPLNPNLSYFWTMERRPAGSTAAIQNDTSKQPTFVPDMPGTYIASLVVVDVDGLVSGRDSATIVANRETPPNSVPRCVLELQYTDADSNGSLNIGESATLDASNSVDGENDQITYRWRQVAGPAVVFLPDPEADVQTVTFPSAGDYVFEVQVWDGTDVGIPAEITISVAAAGTVVPAATGAIDAADDPNSDGYVLMIPGVGVDNNSGNPAIDISAAGSTVDPGLTATYRWSLIRGPTVSLAGADTATVSFIPQISRVYEFELVVSDSNGVSSVARIAVAVDTWDATYSPGGNAVPRVTGAPDQTVTANTPVTLNGSATDPNDGSAGLIYIWVQRIGPPVFLNTSTPTAPTFTAPIAGTYAFTLYVDDGHDVSPGFDVVITAEQPVIPPPSDSGDGGGDDNSGCGTRGAELPLALVLMAVAGLAARRRRTG